MIDGTKFWDGGFFYYILLLVTCVMDYHLPFLITKSYNEYENFSQYVTNLISPLKNFVYVNCHDFFMHVTP